MNFMIVKKEELEKLQGTSYVSLAVARQAVRTLQTGSYVIVQKVDEASVARQQVEEVKVAFAPTRTRRTNGSKAAAVKPASAPAKEAAK